LRNRILCFCVDEKQTTKKGGTDTPHRELLFFVSVQSFSLDCAQKLSKKKKSKKKGEKDE